MAYCLRSLVQILEQVMHPEQHYKNWVLDHDKIPQIQSLLENATFLRDFFDTTSPLILGSMECLEDQIMEAAGKAEDTLEAYIISQVPERENLTISPPDLGDVLRAFEVAKQQMKQIEDAGQPSEHAVSPSVSSTRYSDSKNVVGVQDDLNLLRNRLTGNASTLDIIPIVGMGGTGKTTLARILYDEFATTKYHFDVFAWVCVSQRHSPQLILKTILAFVTGEALSDIPQQNTAELIVTLHQTLASRRYLIVLDDIWSHQAWDDVQMAFQKYDNRGSRIILTTREKDVAIYINSNSHEMHFMNEYDSWELVRTKVFGEKSCPAELEDVGKKIAIKCGGLPLALQVIGGHLAQLQKSKTNWEYVECNVSSLIAKTEVQFAGIFSWSYAHLPHYLKPCFLYMGAFPEDHAIQASKLIKMWVAEGFLYPIRDKSLEEAAEIHLNALVHRNLIFIREWKTNGKAKSYGIHDLLRDLCSRKAQEKNFLIVKDSKTSIQEDPLCSRRVCVHITYPDDKDEFESQWEEDEEGDEEEVRKIDDDTEYFLSYKPSSHARSFQVIGYSTDNIMFGLCLKLPLLQVLDLLSVYFDELPEMILQLFNLRYLAIDVNNYCLRSSISKLKNLQTLIVTRTSIAVIVDLPQLRHIKISNVLDTNEFPYEKISSPRENLRSISNMQLDILLQLTGKLPNLRKLGFYCSEGPTKSVVDLTSFSNLEILKIANGFSVNSRTLISNIIFPISLKKLTLSYCDLPRSLLDAIAMLPNLQVLKFICCEFESKTWEPTEDEFRQLHYLEFRASNLKNWSASESHYPVLRHLFLDQCSNIDEITSEIGEINTLDIIEVDGCKPSVFGSAMRINAGHMDNGNYGLQLRLGKARKLVRILNQDNAAEFQEVPYSIDDMPEDDLSDIHIIYVPITYSLCATQTGTYSLRFSQKIPSLNMTTKATEKHVTH